MAGGIRPNLAVKAVVASLLGERMAVAPVQRVMVLQVFQVCDLYSLVVKVRCSCPLPRAIDDSAVFMNAL